jgi:hypothetical protein
MPTATVILTVQCDLEAITSQIGGGELALVVEVRAALWPVGSF